MLHKKGFTLIEILIALFIFTLVAIIISTALHTVFTTQSATQKQAERLAALQIALILMSRDIEQTVNRPIINAKNNLENAFLGTSHTLTLTHTGIANPFGQLRRSTLQRTRYSFDNNNLIRETWGVLDQVASSQSNPRLLFSPLLELQFSYLDDKGHFQKNWPPPDHPQADLPRAVRVFLTIENWGNLSQLYLIPGQTSLVQTH